jgi:hypothetical protein
MKFIGCAFLAVFSATSFATTPEQQEACLAEAQAGYAAAQAAARSQLQAALDRCDLGGTANVADRCYQIAGRRLEADDRAAQAQYQAELAACLR